MSVLKDLRFYTTHPHTCSYLPDREATTLFLDPNTPVSPRLYSYLTWLGFRRSGEHFYRPYCTGCQACIPVRLLVKEYQPSRKQRRNWRQNQQLVVIDTPPSDHSDIYDLYERYINARHADGDMYPPSAEQFQSFLAQPLPYTRFYQFFQDSQLVAVAVTDLLQDGLSAIYTFFDPALHKLGLGTYCIQWQIEECRSLGLDYLYLGYWISNCSKMTYKSHFAPLEQLIDDQWQPF